MMRFNILHRTAVEHFLDGDFYEIFKQQQELVHSLGMKSTVLVSYSDMFENKVIEDLINYRDEYGDEIGLSLHRLNGPELDEEIHNLNSIWLFNNEEKHRILKTILDKYKEIFRNYPQAVASYHFDASSLEILKEIAPEVKIVVGGCFEEGVRVFHGCNHSWYLFNEGMPWAPWYPSKGHSLRPAASKEDWSGVVAIPHLCRDMSLSFEGRNDFWASHPPNVIRGMGNDASYCPYDLNLVDQYRMQEHYNKADSYYNTFVNPSWLFWNHNSEYPPEVAWTLYKNMLSYCAELKQSIQLIDMTMSEYADWHIENKDISKNESEIYFAKEMLYGSGKHYIWYKDKNLRLLIDTAQGGSIGDLRPYVGRIEMSTGPNTENMQIGSYPYIIQSQQRTGYANHYEDGSRTTLIIKSGDESIDLCTKKTRCAKLKKTENYVLVELEPVLVKFKNGCQVEITTIYQIEVDGKILIKRLVKNQTENQINLELTEYFKGCFGKTEYPEKLYGITLEIGREKCESIKYKYTGKKVECDNSKYAAVHIPMAGCSVSLESDNARYGYIKEGHLFSPYYTMALSSKINKEGTVCTWLNLKNE